MGRTRRQGPRPQLSRTEIQYETLERLKQLKKHKDEPLFKVYDRACTALEEYTDIKDSLERAYEGNARIQKRLTATFQDLFLLIKYMDKDKLQEFLNVNRNELSEDTILEIKRVSQVFSSPVV